MDRTHAPILDACSGPVAAHGVAAFVSPPTLAELEQRFDNIRLSLTPNYLSLCTYIIQRVRDGQKPVAEAVTSIETAERYVAALRSGARNDSAERAQERLEEAERQLRFYRGADQSDPLTRLTVSRWENEKREAERELLLAERRTA